MAKIPEKSEIKNAIEDYCKMKAISKEVLATQISVSGATLSNIANDKWQSIDDRMWLKIWNQVKPGSQLFNTTDYSTVMKLCDKAKANHFMVGLIADTGMGKTTAIESFARRENVFYIYYDSIMRPKHFYYELGKLLGYEFEGSMYEMVNKASEALNRLNDPLIIVDEAGKLTDAMCLSLHVLRDKTRNNCGIVLAGMPYFKNNLIKKANKQKVGISEFYRRIMMWNQLNGLSGGEIEFVCQSNGINDKKDLARFKGFKKFGDLTNEILLFKTIND